MKVPRMLSCSVAAMLTLASCETLQLPDISGKTEGTIHTRAMEGISPLRYPLSIYAYEGTTLKDSVMLTKETTFSLSQASVYNALSWEEPIYFGTSSTPDIILSPMQAQLSIALQGINADEVTLTVHSTHQYINRQGEYRGTADRTLPLKLNASGTWTATEYLYPTTTDSTYMTISASDLIDTPDGNTRRDTKNYRYIYPHPLLAATPYEFDGQLISTQQVSGTISLAPWQERVKVSFSFSENSFTTATDVPGSPGTPEGEYILSSETWADVPSAYVSNEAQTVASEYEEGGHTWRIPTKDEARQLKTLYPNKYDKDTRFLCENATYTFSFAEGTVISKAGTKSTYHLILVADK